MKTDFRLTYFPDAAKIPDQSEVADAIQKLQTERRGLEARLRADGKVFKPVEFSEDSPGYIFRQGDELLGHVIYLRGLAAGTQATPAKTVPSPQTAALALAAPTQSFATANVDELCAAVKAGKLTAADAGKLLDCRFKKPTPLTASCIAAKTKK